jgi:hypothetical protein
MSRSLAAIRWTSAQWTELAEISDEPLCAHAEFVRRTDRNIRALRASGILVTELTGDVADYVAWCRDQGLRLDQRSRASYAARLLMRRSEH